MRAPRSRSVSVGAAEMASGMLGANDELLTRVERLGLRVTARGGEISLSGEDGSVVDAAADMLEQLAALARRGERAGEAEINAALAAAGSGERAEIAPLADSVVCVSGRGRRVKPQTAGQRAYVEAIAANDITFGIGPAGTGKTYLAAACAFAALKDKTAERIVLVRPVVEAGEHLGYLPGDVNEKIDPYIRPLYDAFYDLLPSERFARYVERGTVEIAPLAYMRGRTLDRSFIVLDEAQNTTKEQMKMFLTRLGLGSKAVITGDITQTDLPRGTESGLRTAERVLGGVDGIAFCRLSNRDVVRHDIVRRIIKAYEDYEQTADGLAS